jgi:hypothetical protein
MKSPNPSNDPTRTESPPPVSDTTRTDTLRLADLLARTVVDPATLRVPEAVAHLTWAFAMLDYTRKKDVARREAILALSPLGLPDREKLQGNQPITVGQYQDFRMNQLQKFDPKTFVANFGEVK